MASEIHRAVTKNGLAAVKAVVNRDPEAADLIAPAGGQKGVTPIQIAARHGQTEMAALLYGLNADLEARDLEHGCTALGWAAYSGQAEMVELLVRFGANVNDTCCPLRLATNQGHPEVAKILKRCGARDVD